MAQASSSKGNPAHKRMSNANLKARRAASWLRGQKRKAQRIKEQQEREAKNVSRRANGELTPWEQVKLVRRQRRAENPDVQKRAAKFGTPRV